MTVKMSSEALDELRAAVTPLDTAELRATYIARDFPRAELVKDLNKRYRWDLLSMALGRRFAVAQYDAGLSDVHLDTALRNVVAPLEGIVK